MDAGQRLLATGVGMASIGLSIGVPMGAGRGASEAGHHAGLPVGIFAGLGLGLATTFAVTSRIGGIAGSPARVAVGVAAFTTALGGGAWAAWEGAERLLAPRA